MRRAIALALAGLVLIAAPVQAHDTTPALEFAQTMIGHIEVMQETLTIAADMAGNSGGSFLAFAAESLADGLRADLLDMVPDPCYLEMYGYAWVMAGLLGALGDAESDAYRLGIIRALRSHLEDIPTVLAASSC